MHFFFMSWRAAQEYAITTRPSAALAAKQRRTPELSCSLRASSADKISVSSFMTARNRSNRLVTLKGETTHDSALLGVHAKHIRRERSGREGPLKQVSVVLYGRGGTLGNFEVFARDLATTLRAAGKQVVVQNTERCSTFFNFLASPLFLHTARIAELHIFSHSIGAGLFLGYGDAALDEVAVPQAAREL